MTPKQEEDFDRWTAECMEADFAWRREEHRRLFWKAIPKALANRTKKSDWSINRMQRWGYMLKCFICMAFGWKRNRGHRSHPEHITICVIEHNKLYAGWECETLEVGYDQWWYEIRHDSDWFM